METLKWWSVPSRRKSIRQLRDRERKSTHLFRVNLLYGVFFLSSASLILRLGYLQIAKGAEMRTQAVKTSVQKIPVLPARGRIYDTNGNLLAYDQPSYSAYFTRIKHVNDNPDAIRTMAGLLSAAFQEDYQKVLSLMTADPSDATVRLFTNVTDEHLAYISEHQSELPGINIEVDGRRYYPYGDLAGQVLGYVGPITQTNKKHFDQKKYLSIQKVGETGIESVYEDYLQGKVGQQLQQIDIQNNATKNLGYDPAQVSGDNLQLTLDGRLQADTQNAIVNAISDYQAKNNAQITDGAAVMIDVKTGGILAMASYPYFNPNWFVTGDFMKHLNYLKSSGAQMNNVIQNPHYPGSTVKPANLITGLEHGAINPNTVYDDSTPILLIGTHKMSEDANYGAVNDIRAIAVSDDKFFYSLGLTLGHWFGSTSTTGGYPEGGNLQRWRNTSFIKGMMTLIDGEQRFGLGTMTGVDLPGEENGSFYMEDQSLNAKSTTVTIHPDKVRQSLQKTGAYHNYGSPFDLASLAFGQSQQFTPIELGQYVATIASNGVRLQPHLLQAVLPPGMKQSLTAADTAQPMSVFQPLVQAKLNINPAYLKMAQEGMYAACNEADGTAFAVFQNAPYKAAGKTGTAEIVMHGQKINNSVFIGYAPYDHPQVAVAVMVPGAGWGATTAVPIAKQMMDDYFKEHHLSFMAKDQWADTSIPANWFESPAYKVPEAQN